MKFCYCDESGTGDEPIAVMVGVIVDAKRMHVTKKDWSELLVRVLRIVSKVITEIHTRDLYSGNDAWRALKGQQRAEIITSTLDWLRERKHDIVYASVEKAKYLERLKAGQIKAEIRTMWRFMGLHLMLAVQRAHQREALYLFSTMKKERR
jgi:acyl-CoA reductase-like NAD-dependent aldehyde dehydrogenase